MYYQRARELDPGLRDRAGHRIAIVCDRLDDQATAMKEFAELLQRRPKDAALLNDVGYSYYNRGQWAEAEAHLKRAVAAEKGNKRAWVNLGLAKAQQGKQTEALEAFGKAVSAAEAASARGRQQLAAAERAIPRQPRGLAAPYSQAVKEGMAYRVAHDGAVLDVPAGALQPFNVRDGTPGCVATTRHYAPALPRHRSARSVCSDNLPMPRPILPGKFPTRSSTH